MARLRRRRGHAAAGVDTRVHLGPLELPNPIVAASGTFGHGDEVAGLCDPAALGAVTAKSQAPFAWAGNPPPRLHPVPATLRYHLGISVQCAFIECRSRARLIDISRLHPAPFDPQPKGIEAHFFRSLEVF